MADPILGEKVVLQILKDSSYQTFICAQEVEIQFNLETKSVKTINDGIDSTERGQKRSYQIDLTGLIKFDDGTVPHAFDLYDYYTNMTDIPYRLIFEEPETTLVKVFTGNALITSLNLGGGSEGFANTRATLKGNGPITLSDSTTGCEATLGAFTANGSEDNPGQVSLNFTDGVSSDTVRVEFSIDGGGRDVFFPPSTETPFLYNITGVAPGMHSIEFFPVCENGIDGTSQTKSVTVF